MPLDLVLERVLGRSLARRGRWSAFVLAVFAVLGCGDGSKAPAPPPALEAVGFFESDGLQIHYQSFGERGDGVPIILMHGWSLDLEFNWVSPGWVDALRSSRQVIAFDVRGHGESDKPHRQEFYSYREMARDVLNLMDHFGVERADLMGYSLGSFSGAYLLGHHTERFRSMILGGIGNETTESLAEAPRIAAALRAERVEDITDPLGLGYRVFVDLDARNDREALAVAALQMWPEGFPLELGGPGLADVNIPVLLVNGSEDFPYVETDQDIAGAIPGARLVELPGPDHVGAIFDPRFVDEVLAFLAAQDG